MPDTTNAAVSSPSDGLSALFGGNPPRMVRCQYRQDPHPLDDECLNVTDAWPDEVLEAGLQRVFAAIDGLPPALKLHPSHRPEPPGTELVRDCTACVVCCLIVSGTRGVLPAGIRPCSGPGRVQLRGGR